MKRIVLPEGGDERIREAARRIEAEGVAQAIVFESPPAERIERYAGLYVAARPDAAKIARRLVAKPLYHAGMMVQAGDADAMLAGVSHPTARIIGPAYRGTRRRHPHALQLLPHKAEGPRARLRRLRGDPRPRLRWTGGHRAHDGRDVPQPGE